MRHTRRGSLYAALAIAALLMAGCGAIGERLTEEAAERAAEEVAGRAADEDVDIEMDEDGLSVQGESGGFEVGGELPDTWPDDVPLPDEAQIISSGIDDSDGSPAHMAMVQVPGVPAEVVAAYVELAADTGWEIDEEGPEVETMRTLVNGDRGLLVNATEIEDGTTGMQLITGVNQ